MLNTKKLLSELRALAHDKDPNDVLWSLNYLREQLAKDTTPEYRTRDCMVAKIPAAEILVDADKIARRTGTRHALLRYAAGQMGQSRWGAQRNVDRPFAVRYVVDGKRHRLQLVGPVNAQPGFLVAYAFWVLAKRVPVATWLTPERKTCNLDGCNRRVPASAKMRGRRSDYCCEAHRREARRIRRRKPK